MVCYSCKKAVTTEQIHAGSEDRWQSPILQSDIRAQRGPMTHTKLLEATRQGQDLLPGLTGLSPSPSAHRPSQGPSPAPPPHISPPCLTDRPHPWSPTPTSLPIFASSTGQLHYHPSLITPHPPRPCLSAHAIPSGGDALLGPDRNTPTWVH